MKPYQDPNDEGNSSKHHTGKMCVENCGNVAGTAWSPLWCFDCNVKRMDSISKSLKELAYEFTPESKE